MQIFAHPPHFWTSSHVQNPDALLDCFLQAEGDKNQSALQTIYCFKNLSRGAGFTLFSTDPRHFQPVLLYERPEVGR
jgi:hypothetical protein